MTDLTEALRRKQRIYSRKYTAAWTPEQRERYNTYQRAYLITVPGAKKKRSVRAKAQWAVKSGKLAKLPCAVCCSLDVQMHHPDYSEPYEVVWLCMKHHGVVHRHEPRVSYMRAEERIALAGLA